jgi:hypothetical protein
MKEVITNRVTLFSSMKGLCFGKDFLVKKLASSG